MTKIIFDLCVHVSLFISLMLQCDCSSSTSTSDRNGFFNSRSINITYPPSFQDTALRFTTIADSTPIKTSKVSIQTSSSTFGKKQYEVISMLLRKTKVYIDTDSGDTKYHLNNKSINFLNMNKQPNKLFTTNYKIQTTTPSKIEFYYWNNDDADNVSRKICKEEKYTIVTEKILDIVSTKSNSSFLMFHIKGPLKKRYYRKDPLKTTMTPSNLLFLKQINGRTLQENQRLDSNSNIEPKTNSYKYKTYTTNPFYKREFEQEKIVNKSLSKYRFTIYNSNITTKEKTTQPTNDKIKFFEIYDKNTPTSDYEDYNDNVEAYNFRRKSQDLINNSDQGSSHGHHDSKLSKKHVITRNITKIAILTKLTITNTSTTTKKITRSKAVQRKVYYNNSARWSDYPFVAVYIYEPSQVHCDAAGINSYWLVASGSCLSRLNKNPNGEGQSAFITYCGDKWWQPSRISYVKYTLVHPSFHSTDVTRRHLYNIGVIQVATSMTSACYGWTPVTIMSHQFTTDPEGSEALALGWGLDRFDTRYNSMDLPKNPLTVYQEKVYSNSCPGNNGYSVAKGLNEGGGVRNVYCLSLPPYSGEENDTVHGSLLLVEGKLIALYLQEERRPMGPQSAQYTGIWRLLPWLMNIAREPEDYDMILM